MVERPTLAGEHDGAQLLAHALATHPLLRRLTSSLAGQPGRREELAPPLRPAAVALVLREGAEGALDLLFIKRAEFEGDPWSGHIAFPGGRFELTDTSLEETAVRETREELALDLRRDGVLLGTLDDLRPRTPALPPVVVRPYVALVRHEVVLHPSDEVALAFWVPLERLRAPDAGVESTIEVRGARWRVPSFVHEGHTIWGMTERILRNFLERLAG